MQTFFNQAKQAVYIRIELKPASQAIGTETLAHILLALNTSFLNLAEAEITNRYSNNTPVLKKETKLFLAAAKLVVADADFADLIFALAPHFSPVNHPFKALTNFMSIKEACFQLWVDTVFTDAIFDLERVNKMAEKYNAKQRIGIFKLIYDGLINQEEFVVYFGSSPSSTQKTWIKTADKAVLESLVPKAEKKDKEAVETYYQLVKTGEESDLFGKRATYKKVLVREKAAHDIYPYQLKKVRVGQNDVFLNRQLSAEVTVKDGTYQISLPELWISVKEQSRAEAEQAFDTAIAQLIGKFTKNGQSGTDQKSTAVFLKLQELLA